MKSLDKDKVIAEKTISNFNSELKPKIRGIEKQKRNAGYKRKTEKIYAKSGFITVKLRLGSEVMKKLEEIYKDQLNKEIDFERKDLDGLSQVTSYCINECYQKLYIDEENGDLPNITPAISAKAQELYNLYQAVSFRAANELMMQKIAFSMESDGYTSPHELLRSKKGSAKNPFLWTAHQVEQLLDIDWLNRSIKDLNNRRDNSTSTSTAEKS